MTNHLPDVLRPKPFNKGFTLIELLIVIIIIGILAGVVIAVINPVAQQRRSKEGVMRANLDKVCTALLACMSSQVSISGLDCNSADELGVLLPNEPAEATYSIYGYDSYAYAYTRIGTSGVTTGTNAGCSMACLVYSSFADWNGRRPGIVNVDVNFGIQGGYCFLDQ